MFGSEQNVRVCSGTEPEPPFGFMFGGFAEPNTEHYVQFGFEHCSQCSEPDRGQSSSQPSNSNIMIMDHGQNNLQRHLRLKHEQVGRIIEISIKSRGSKTRCLKEVVFAFAYIYKK